jgi:chromosome segregation ATPase
MRGGLNLAVVRTAHQELERMGVYPSAQAIRNHLGSGSIGTIHGHLKTIQAESGETWGELGRVNRTLAETVLSLHNQLKSSVDDEIATAREECDQRVAKLEEALAVVNSLLTKEREATAILSGKLETATSMYNALDAAHDEAKLRIAKQDHQIESSAQQIELLKAQLRKAEGDVTHARQDRTQLESRMADEMASLRKSSSKAIDDAQYEVGELNKQLNEKSAQVAEFKMLLTVAETDSRNAATTLAEVRTSHAELRISHGEVLEKSAAKDQRIEDLRNQVELIQSRELEGARELIAVQGALAQIKQELIAAKSGQEHTRTENESLHTQLEDARRTISQLNSESA